MKRKRKSDMQTCVVIKSDGSVLEHNVEKDDLDKFQEFVGGYIEAAPLPPSLMHKCTIYVNDSGKLAGLPLNKRATTLWCDLWAEALNKMPKPLQMPGDYLVGDVIVTGGVNEEGESLTIPAWLKERALK